MFLIKNSTIVRPGDMTRKLTKPSKSRFTQVTNLVRAAIYGAHFVTLLLLNVWRVVET